MRSDSHQGGSPLPRGGFLIPAKQNTLQYGVPPETIKDTLESETGVPQIFVLPHEMFSMDAGISLAELEFPIYYNFFFRQQKIRVVCTLPQKERLTRILTEALFGPENLEYENEFIQGSATPGYPDLAREMLNFRTMPIKGEIRPMELEDVIEFSLIEPRTPVHLEGLTISLDHNHTYGFEEEGQTIARFSPDTPLIPVKKPDFSSGRVFYPPLFGITTLGSGHGFAPDAMTSGMIIWVNRRGILVDPPVNAALELVRLGVPPRILDSVILTHCHADHDAGSLQKIMQEGSITLYTTPTIFKSFMRKSSALTNIPRALMEKAVKFIPLTIGAPVNINGGIFQFSYTLHSIPTISIQAGFGDKTMVYSSDTHNDPDYVNQLYEKEVVDEKRRDFLNAFPWHRDIIFHEAGIPPLHTPMDTLTALPEDVRKRMYLVHVTREMIPEESGLQIAPTGLSATVELNVSPPESSRAIEILGTYLDQPLFKGLPPEKTMEFLCIAQTRQYKPEEIIIRAGDTGEHIFFIMTGQVEVIQQGASLTPLGRSDFFGEKCLFTTGPRTASVIAKSDLRLIAVHKRDMLAFIRNTFVEQTLFHLSSVQDRTLRQRLDLNPVFAHLTPSQKTQLFQILTPAAGPGDGEASVIREGEPLEACYFISHGQVKVYKNNRERACLEPGNLFGTKALFDTRARSEFSFSADPDTMLFLIKIDDLKEFTRTNPGVYLKLYAHDY